MKNKTCISCNKKHSLNKFYKNNRQKDGYDYYCKYCRIGNSTKSHRGGSRKSVCTVDNCDNFNYAKGMCKIHYERNRRNGHPGLVNYGRKKYKKQYYETLRKNHLKRTFKLTVDEYNEMAKNGCEICGKMGMKHKKLHVDHDHKCCPVPKINGVAAYHKTCGKCVRGVLCDKCNGCVGLYERNMMREDYPLRDRIISYIAKYNQVISDRMVSYDKEQGNR